MKAIVASSIEDQDFVYKKHDNYVVLLFKLKLPDGFKLEDLKDIQIGF